jgi:aerobic carbon-monoxide dehydrogenase small subunit
MLAANVLKKSAHLPRELNDVLASNLCRCTGYPNLIKAVGAGCDAQV